MSEDASTALIRAIRRCFAAGDGFLVKSIKSRNWASGAFIGARHELVFHLTGDGAAAAADRFIEGLEEREFDLRRHLLADIRVIARDGSTRINICLEALTVESD